MLVALLNFYFQFAESMYLCNDVLILYLRLRTCAMMFQYCITLLNLAEAKNFVQ
jgi:hypothetical protein